MTEAYFTNPLIFLVKTLFGLYIAIVMIRFLLQWARADFYNPISQFVVKVTSPVLRPMRKVIPGYGGLDLSALVLAWLLKAVELALMSMLFELVPEPVSALYLGLVLGLPMGLVHGRLLKQKNIPATLWPLINVSGYLFAAAIIVFLSGEGREWVIVLMGLLVGAVTGLGMMWLLRREKAVTV